jgi:hypothetical protein
MPSAEWFFIEALFAVIAGGAMAYGIAVWSSRS